MKKRVRILDNRYDEIDLSNIRVVFKSISSSPGKYVLVEPKTRKTVILDLRNQKNPLYKPLLKGALEVFLSTLLRQAFIMGRQRGPSGLGMVATADKVVFAPMPGQVLYGFCGKLWGDPTFAVVVSAPECAFVRFERGKIYIRTTFCPKEMKDEEIAYAWMLGKPQRVPLTLEQIIRVVD